MKTNKSLWSGGDQGGKGVKRQGAKQICKGVSKSEGELGGNGLEVRNKGGDRLFYLEPGFE